jgi:lysozyme
VRYRQRAPYPMNLSAQGLALIKNFEGYRDVAYKDANGLWACGYGHTDLVNAFTTCDESVAETWLANDTSWAQALINTVVTGTLNQNQFDALVSFSYNVGPEAFHNSTLLRLLNAGDMVGAASQFVLWDHIDGQVVAGLLKRRQAEADLFQEAV